MGQQGKVEFEADRDGMNAAINRMNLAIDTLSEIGADQTLGVAADHEQFMRNKETDNFKRCKEFLQSTISKVRMAPEAVSGFLNPAQSKSVQSFVQSQDKFGCYDQGRVSN